MKVFWSWQSDTPGHIGRFFIRDCIKDAIAILKSEIEITSPDARDDLAQFQIDQDREGTTGSPNLADTILEKIDRSLVVIADVTLTGTALTPKNSKKPKKFINSNVAIELGYALKSISTNRVLMIFNTFYGIHEELPFDLRHKGGGITFCLSPDADKQEIQAQRKILIAKVREALAPFIILDTTPPSPVVETPFTYLRAVYTEPDATVAKIGQYEEEMNEFCFHGDSFAYLRLIPSVLPKRPHSITSLKEIANNVPLIYPTNLRGLVTQNAYGAIHYAPKDHKPGLAVPIKSGTQLFKNGELWAIWVNPVNYRMSPAQLPHFGFEQVMYDSIAKFMKFNQEQQYISGDFQLEIGLSGIKDTYLNVRNAYEPIGPCFENEVYSRQRIMKAHGTHTLLATFYDHLFDIYGERRPDGLYGFPPQRPA